MLSYDVSLELNRYRNNYNYPPLVRVLELDNLAFTRCYDMYIHNYFSHTSPTKKDIFNAINNTKYKQMGENLAKNFISAKDIIKAWDKSALHKEQMLLPYDDYGLSTVGDYTCLVLGLKYN